MRRVAFLVAVGCSGATTPATPPRDATALAPAAKLFLAAVEAKDWAAAVGAIQRRHVELAGAPFDPQVVAALDSAWDPIASWLASQTTVTGAYFALARLADALPPDRRDRLTALADRAKAEQVELGRAAHGPGGAWLHAALRAKIGEDRAAREAADGVLATALRPDFDIFPFPRSCNWIASPARTVGHRVDVATSGLSCQATDERTWDTTDPYGYVDAGVTRIGTRTTHHRVIVARITGNVTLRWEGGEREVALAIDTGVDEIAFTTPHGNQAFSPVTGDQARPEAGHRFQAALTAAATEAWTTGALAAGKAALGHDVATAEDQLVIHARLASPSAELGALLARYGVTIGELF